MKNSTYKFGEIATSSSARYHSKFVVDNTEYFDTLNNFKIVNTINADSDISIGCTCASEVSFKLYKPQILFENKEVTFYEGLEVDGEIEYIQLGVFLITSAESDGEYTEYVGYDRMYSKFEYGYFSELAYPSTDIQIIEEICRQRNVTCDTSTLTAHTIQQKPNGYSMREMIGYIAALSGKNATINASGELVFKWYETTPYTLDSKNIYQDSTTFTTSNEFVIEKLTCYTTEQTASEQGNPTTKQVELVSGSGNIGISFENPFMTQDILDSIYYKIRNFTFRPLNIRFHGDFRLDVGDLITILKNGIEYATPIMQITHECDRGVVSTIESVGKSETENRISANAPSAKQMERYYAQLALIDNAQINSLYAISGNIENLTASVAKINSLTATDAFIKNIFSSSIISDSAIINTLQSNIVTAGTIEAVKGEVGYLTVEDLAAKLGNFDVLTADSAFVQKLYSSDILSETLDTRYMSTDFANIDIAHINKANIGTMLAEIGLISSAVISEGHVTGFLDSVEINANNITAGTLVADRILLKGTDETDAEHSVLYQLNYNPDKEDISWTTLDGDVITERTISADHLIAHTITANEITTENLIGSNGWYNVHEGTMYLGNANTGKQLSWDGEKLYINSDVIINITDTKYVNMFDDLQKQIDGATDIFFQSDDKSALDVPTLNSYPANAWKSSEYANHKNAMYYANDGTVYRFQVEDVIHGTDEVYSGEDKVQTYVWKIIDDNLITKAVALANEAKQEALSVTTDLGIYKSDMQVELTKYVTTETHTHDLEITQNALKSYIADNYTSTVQLFGKDGKGGVFANYSTTKQIASDIKQTSSSIGLAVSEVSAEKVSSIKIGGENLILQSEDLGKSLIYADIVYDGNNIVYYGNEKVVA